ncbi:MAG TPA: hypothetical protein DCP91_03940 [Eggerthellaceae bacterium]|nr:hypothetical protein [Eggerthellaceae bacterium]
MDNVLVLGAGVYQVPLIRAVQRLGYRAIAASIPGDYPGFGIADEAAHVNTVDRQGILDLARERKVAAVLTAGTDVAIPTLGYVNDMLSLNGPTEATAHLSSDKVAMKRAFAFGGVNTARFTVKSVECGLEECLRSVRDEIGLPAIFKAIDSSGSRGITKVHCEQDVQRAYENVVAATRSDRFLIEECLMGDEFGMQLFVQRGKLSLFLPHGDYLHEGTGTAVPFGHYAPYGTPAAVGQMREQAQRLVAALGIWSGAVNVDAMYSNGHVMIIEAGARAGATGLPELVSLRYGFDYYEAIVASALGDTVDVPEERADVCPVAMLMGSDRPGTVARLEVPEQLPPSVVERTVDFAVGARIPAFNIGPDRLGLVVAGASTVADAELAAYRAIDDVACYLEDGVQVRWLRGRK